MNTYRSLTRSSLFLAVLLSIGPLPAGQVRVVGSDLLGLDFFKAVHAVAVAEAIDVTVALDGSRSGWLQLKTGRAELALLTLPPDDPVDGEIFSSVTLAWHCVFVIVPDALPLKRVYYSQLAAVFARDVPVSFLRWGELGLSGEWSSTPIVPLAPVVGWNLTAEIFCDRVISGKSMKPGVARYTSLADLAHRLKDDSRSLALAPVFPANTLGQKALPVAVRQRDQAFFPTPESLRSGDYPLAIPVAMVFRRATPDKIWPLVRFLLSDPVAVIFERAGLVPMSKLARHDELQSLRAVEGENPKK